MLQCYCVIDRSERRTVCACVRRVGGVFIEPLADRLNPVLTTKFRTAVTRRGGNACQCIFTFVKCPGERDRCRYYTLLL